jgi:hypothetical protein
MWVTLYTDIYFYIKSVQKYGDYMQCGAGLQVTLTAVRLQFITRLTGRSAHVYHHYTLSAADCTHVYTNVVRSCGQSGVQLSSLARDVRVWNWSRRRACTEKGEPSGSLTVQCSAVRVSLVAGRLFGPIWRPGHCLEPSPPATWNRNRTTCSTLDVIRHRALTDMIFLICF